MIIKFYKYNEGLFFSDDEWLEKWINYIKKYGAVETNYMGYDFEMPTKVGKLYLSVSRGDFTLWARFEEPERASKLVDCSENSGKWNTFNAKPMDFWREFKQKIDSVKLSDEELTAIKYNI